MGIAACRVQRSVSAHAAHSIGAMLPRPENGRVALIGDTHADLDWTSYALRRLKEEGIDLAIQLGDFGWWPASGTVRLGDDGLPTPFFPGDITRVARGLGIKLLFIDGNHENHHHLRDWATKRGWDRGASPVEMLDGLWYLPRGCAWTWDEVRFRVVGGAFSIDKEGRTPGRDWFPEETPKQAEIDLAIEAGPADVLVSHDFPDIGYRLPSIYEISDSFERASRRVRQQLAEVVKAVDPELVVHGHWHWRYTKKVGAVTVEGFDCNRNRGAVGVLDLSSLEVTEIDVPSSALYPRED